MRERVRALLDENLSQREVAERLGVGKSTVAFHARRLDVPLDMRFARRYDWKAIRAAYETGLSRRECMRKFGFSVDAWHKAVKRGAIVLRPKAMPIDDLLVVGRKTSRHHLKNRLLGEGLKENRCEECGIATWRGKPLSVQFHHINGDGSDNRLENIIFLCPNCHSQTDTYGGRNGHRKPERHLKLVEPPDESDEEEVG
jgi:5-methylcytosine-specific restriction endonuclease McrA